MDYPEILNPCWHFGGIRAIHVRAGHAAASCDALVLFKDLLCQRSIIGEMNDLTEEQRRALERGEAVYLSDDRMKQQVVLLAADAYLRMVKLLSQMKADPMYDDHSDAPCDPARWTKAEEIDESLYEAEDLG